MPFVLKPMPALRKLLLLLTVMASAPACALTVVSTHQEDETRIMLEQFQRAHPGIRVTLLNRRAEMIPDGIQSGSLRHADVVLTSSTAVMQDLKQAGLLLTLPASPENSPCAPPGILLRDPDQRFASYGLAGFGLLWNNKQFQHLQLSEPRRWNELLDRRLYGQFVMSTPTRSTSTHLLVEQLLQQQGWERGWATLLQLGGWQKQIAARSFSVRELVGDGAALVGPTIDSSAKLLTGISRDFRFTYFDTFPVMPAYIAQLRHARHPEEARKLFDFLFSSMTQQRLHQGSLFRFPLNPHKLDAEGQRMCQLIRRQRPVDQQLLLERSGLVQQLYDTLITRHFEQLRDVWGLIVYAEHQARLSPEQRKLLQQARKLASTPPVSAQQASNRLWIKQFIHNDTATARSEVQRWQRVWGKQLDDAGKLARRALVESDGD